MIRVIKLDNGKVSSDKHDIEVDEFEKLFGSFKQYPKVYGKPLKVFLIESLFDKIKQGD